jgi:hypothetical protein
MSKILCIGDEDADNNNNDKLIIYPRYLVGSWYADF